MKKVFVSICLAMMSMAGMAATSPVIMYGKPNQTVTSISSNGRWACGVQSDGTNPNVAFVWDLDANEITPLGMDTQAYGVSDDGIVVGVFPSSEESSNGATTSVAGYWKEGTWHRLICSNATYSGFGGGAWSISPDGRYIGGALYIGGVYSPVLWKDGELLTVFNDGRGGLVQAMTDDGTLFGGWGYTPEKPDTRQPLLWNIDGGKTILNGLQTNPYQAVYDFTSDGKYALYVGYIQDGNNITTLGIRNLATGEDILIPYVSDDYRDVVLYGLSDSLSAVGFETEMSMATFPIIYKNGVTQKLETYLIERGVDFAADGIIGKRTSDTEGQFNLVRCNDISNDDSTFAIQAGNVDMFEIPVIVKLNANATNPKPVGVKASVLSGLKVAKVSWKAPLLNSENIVGYDVYRNGEKQNTEPITTTAYYDKNVEPGSAYSYSMTALFDGGAVSSMSDAVSITMPADGVNAPRSPYVRMKGYDDVLLTWMQPQSNRPTLQYYDDTDEISGFSGGNKSFEAAARFDGRDMPLYSGYNISAVKFCPRKKIESWVINIYSGEELVYNQTVDQELQYGRINTVALSSPVAVPTSGDLYVAIQANVSSLETSSDILGMVYDKATFGYSDLIRLVGEERFFYSIEDDAEEASGTSYPVSFIIGAEFSLADDSQADIDNISGYNVYRDNVSIGNTEATTFVDKDVAEGNHTYSVEAVYANGGVSAKTSIDIDAAPDMSLYSGIDEVVCTKGDTKSQVVFSWDAPADNDETRIQYCGDQTSNGPVGPEENGYGYMARSTYAPSRLRSYNGYTVSALRFYPQANAEFTFFVMKDGKVITEQYVENYTLNKWNTVKLDEPFVIDEKSTYDLILDCFDVTAGMPALGIDGMPTFSGLADVVSTDGGETYTTISMILQTDTPGNWLMGMVASDGEGAPLPVEGYNVRIDAKSVTDQPITTTTYTHDFGEGASVTSTHRLNVDVIYSVVGKAEGSNIFFTISDAGDPTGIEGNVINDIKITHDGTSYVRVEGDGIQGIDVYSVGGALVDSTTGNTVNVSAIQGGMYLLKVRTDSGVKTCKVRVTR